MSVGALTVVAWPRTIKKNPETRSAIYDGPVVKLIATTEKAFEPFQPIIVDKYGDMLVEATDFLRVKRSKSKRNSVESTYQYARVLADLLFVFDSAGGGWGSLLEHQRRSASAITNSLYRTQIFQREGNGESGNHWSCLERSSFSSFAVSPSLRTEGMDEGIDRCSE